jgi:hypothetical protein
MKLTAHQVQVAGEAFAASLFARARCDVLVQYGPNQPDYDLVAMRDEIAIPVSVKASQYDGWGLIQSYKKGRTYAEAAEAWLKAQRADIIFCLVCLWKCELDAAPLAFLATPKEIAEQHKTGKHGSGTTILYLDYTPKRGLGKDFQHKIPSEWKFTQKRVDDLYLKNKTQIQTPVL